MKVAILIPTMNRPDFMLRQFKFCELMNSPHPIYISDSSNPGNSEKLKQNINKFKNLNITYQWAPPGKDPLYSLLPLVKEKYCMRMGDDDLMIPDTISECADFLENNLDYGTCMGKQVNIRLRPEDYDKPYGIVAKQTVPLGGSIEDDDIFSRVKSFWSKSFYICFTVKRTEVEKSICDLTKNLSLAGNMTEFLVLSILITSGKSKSLDKLGYIMQISNIRYAFDRSSYSDIQPSSNSEQWRICKEGLSAIIQKKGISREESFKIIKELHKFYLGQYSPKTDAVHASSKSFFQIKKFRHFIARLPFLKTIYYKINPPSYVTRPESRYYEDYKKVKDFLESNIKPLST